MQCWFVDIFIQRKVFNIIHYPSFSLKSSPRSTNTSRLASPPISISQLLSVQNYHKVLGSETLDSKSIECNWVVMSVVVVEETGLLSTGVRSISIRLLSSSAGYQSVSSPPWWGGDWAVTTELWRGKYFNKFALKYFKIEGKRPFCEHLREIITLCRPL